MKPVDREDPFKDLEPIRPNGKPKVVRFPDDRFPPADVYADEFTNGHDFREMTDMERDALDPFDFPFWGAQDLAAIPLPQFIYCDFYARGYTSVTFAPPKVGKSMLGLAEAIDMASGRGILTGQESERRKVLYYNAEDDFDAIKARVAAILCHYEIEQRDIADTLMIASGVESEGFYMISGKDGIINEMLFSRLEKTITTMGLDALIFDPLQDLSSAPETNEVFRLLGQRLRKLASTHRVAIGLIHHTRKIAPGTQATIDDGRGGSALRGTSRFNRLLLSMTEDEAIKAGVDNHRYYMRISDVESNLAPPSASVNRWFEKVSVEIPNGGRVGAVAPWSWPDAFDGISTRQTAECQAAVAARSTPPRLDVRASDWVGKIIAPVLDLDIDKPADKARLKVIIKTWIGEDVLREDLMTREKDGREFISVTVGANRIEWN